MWLLEIDQTLRKGVLTLWRVGENLDVRIIKKQMEVRIDGEKVVTLEVGNCVAVQNSSRVYDDHSVVTFHFSAESEFSEELPEQTEEVYDIFCRACHARVLCATGKEGYLLPSSAWEAFGDAFACEECQPWKLGDHDQQGCGPSNADVGEEKSGGDGVSDDKPKVENNVPRPKGQMHREQLLKARPGRVYWTSTQAVVHPEDLEIHGNRCRHCDSELGTLAEDGESLALDKSRVSMYRDTSREFEDDLFEQFTSAAVVAMQFSDLLSLDTDRHFTLRCADMEDEEVEIRVAKQSCVLYSEDGAQRAMKIRYRCPSHATGRLVMCSHNRFGPTLKEMEASAERDFTASQQKLWGHWRQAYLPLPCVH